MSWEKKVLPWKRVIRIFPSISFLDFDFSPLLIVTYVGISSVFSGDLCFGSTGKTGNRNHSVEIKMGRVLGNCGGRTAGMFEGETASFSYLFSKSFVKPYHLKIRLCRDTCDLPLIWSSQYLQRKAISIFSSCGRENLHVQFRCSLLLVTNNNNDNIDEKEVMRTFLSL